MGGNQVDAEEALSRATLKAWDKLPKHAEKITNPRAWLTRLTYNLCMDMHRERNRGAKGIESIEEIAVGDKEAVAVGACSPESAILYRELGMYIRRAIKALPPRLRHPFILFSYHRMSYTDIAQKFAISLDNVYKRIQQARDILQKRLRKYLSGLDGTAVEEPHFEEPATSDSPAAMTMGCITEQINYRVTAICLETLPHAWYRSPNPLGWS
jgi:RNA polymerase sigma-70 factor (ECF subfamily)